MVVCSNVRSTCSYSRHCSGTFTLAPRDYDSFATSILTWNYRDIDITELMLVSIKVIISCTYTKDFPIMTSWRSPSLHVAVPFPSVSQVLYYGVTNHHIFIERWLRNHCIKFGGELIAQELKMVIFYTPSSQTEVDGHIVCQANPMTSLLGNPLVQVVAQGHKLRKSQSSTYFTQLCSLWESGGLKRTKIMAKKWNKCWWSNLLIFRL